MKKSYVTPEMETVKYRAEDALTSSTVTDIGGNSGIGYGGGGNGPAR